MTLISLIMLASSCHWRSEVAIIKNNTADTLTVLMWNDRDFGKITDSMLLNDKMYIDDWIDPHKSTMTSLPNRKFRNMPDSEMIDIYIFDQDTLSNLHKNQQIHDLLKRCLLKKISIQANTIKEPITTFHINK